MGQGARSDRKDKGALGEETEYKLQKAVTQRVEETQKGSSKKGGPFEKVRHFSPAPDVDPKYQQKSYSPGVSPRHFKDHKEGYGIHGYRKKPMTKKEKKRSLKKPKPKHQVFDMIETFQITLDDVNAQELGLREDEIEGIRVDLEKLNQSANEAETTADYESVQRDLEDKIKQYNELIADRSEDIGKIMNKIDSIKTLNEQLLALRKNVFEEEKQNDEKKSDGSNKDDDLINGLSYEDLSNEIAVLDQDANDIKNQEGRINLTKQRRAEQKKKEQISDLSGRVRKLEERQKEIIVEQVDESCNQIKKDAQMVEKQIEIAEKANLNVKQSTVEMDGNTSDDEEQQQFDKLRRDSSAYESEIEENKERIRRIKITVEDVEESLDMTAIPPLQDQISDLIKKLHMENLALKNQMEQIINTAYKKSLKKDEELEQIEYLSKDMIAQINQDIQSIEKKGKVVQEKINRMFKCVIKRNLEANYMQTLEEALEEMKNLLEQVKEMEDKRRTTQEEFDEDIPYIILEQRIERRQVTQDKSFMDDQSYQTFGKNTALSERDQEKLQNTEDMRDLVNFSVKYRQAILQMQAAIVKFQMMKLTAMKKIDELEDQHCFFKEDRYKPVKNDKIDEYLADYSNGSGRDLGFSRLDEGVYRIGPKKCHFKRTNADGKILMKCGAGYVDAHQFLDRHYKKVMKLNGQELDELDGSIYEQSEFGEVKSKKSGSKFSQLNAPGSSDRGFNKRTKTMAPKTGNQLSGYDSDSDQRSKYSEKSDTTPVEGERNQNEGAKMQDSSSQIQSGAYSGVRAQESSSQVQSSMPLPKEESKNDGSSEIQPSDSQNALQSESQNAMYSESQKAQNQNENSSSALRQSESQNEQAKTDKNGQMHSDSQNTQNQNEIESSALMQSESQNAQHQIGDDSSVIQSESQKAQNLAESDSNNQSLNWTGGSQSTLTKPSSKALDQKLNKLKMKNNMEYNMLQRMSEQEQNNGIESQETADFKGNKQARAGNAKDAKAKVNTSRGPMQTQDQKKSSKMIPKYGDARPKNVQSRLGQYTNTPRKSENKSKLPNSATNVPPNKDVKPGATTQSKALNSTNRSTRSTQGGFTVHKTNQYTKTQPFQLSASSRKDRTAAPSTNSKPGIPKHSANRDRLSATNNSTSSKNPTRTLGIPRVSKGKVTNESKKGVNSPAVGKPPIVKTGSQDKLSMTSGSRGRPPLKQSSHGNLSINSGAKRNASQEKHQQQPLEGQQQDQVSNTNSANRGKPPIKRLSQDKLSVNSQRRGSVDRGTQTPASPNRRIDRLARPKYEGKGPVVCESHHKRADKAPEKQEAPRLRPPSKNSSRKASQDRLYGNKSQENSDEHCVRDNKIGKTMTEDRPKKKLELSSSRKESQERLYSNRPEKDQLSVRSGAQSARKMGQMGSQRSHKNLSNYQLGSPRQKFAGSMISNNSISSAQLRWKNPYRIVGSKVDTGLRKTPRERRETSPPASNKQQSQSQPQLQVGNSSPENADATSANQSHKAVKVENYVEETKEDNESEERKREEEIRKLVLETQKSVNSINQIFDDPSLKETDVDEVKVYEEFRGNKVPTEERDLEQEDDSRD